MSSSALRWHRAQARFAHDAAGAGCKTDLNQPPQGPGSPDAGWPQSGQAASYLRSKPWTSPAPSCSQRLNRPHSLHAVRAPRLHPDNERKFPTVTCNPVSTGKRYGEVPRHRTLARKFASCRDRHPRLVQEFEPLATKIAERFLAAGEHDDLEIVSLARQCIEHPLDAIIVSVDNGIIQDDRCR